MAPATGGSERAPLLPGGGNNAHAGSRYGSAFGVRPEQLTEMLDPKDPEKLQQLGGAEQICKMLQVDPTVGLRQREQIGASGEHYDEPFQARRAVFGRNILPETEAVTFWQLLMAAYNDRTL
ncbi:plasma membrane calcium, partial [Coemansia brasiliensis]